MTIYVRPDGAMPSALITGASRGIGYGVAARLAARGYGLTITARGQDGVNAVVDDLRELGSPRVVPAAADLSDPAAPAEIVAVHRRAFGSLDVLILNAGIGTAGSVESLPPRRLRKMVDVNFVAPFLLVQESLVMLRMAAQASPQVGSRIIALSSILGIHPAPGLSAYGATKAALLALVDGINREESAGGVLATGLAPGYVDTDMASYVHDLVDPLQMLTIADVSAVVDMITQLSRNAMISRIVMGRSSTDGRSA